MRIKWVVNILVVKKRSLSTNLKDDEYNEVARMRIEMKKIKLENEDKYKRHEGRELLFYSLMTPEYQTQYVGRNKNSKKIVEKKMNVSAAAAATTSLCLELAGTPKGMEKEF